MRDTYNSLVSNDKTLLCLDFGLYQRRIIIVCGLLCTLRGLRIIVSCNVTNLAGCNCTKKKKKKKKKNPTRLVRTLLTLNKFSQTDSPVQRV